jgi:hypothetical protein
VLWRVDNDPAFGAGNPTREKVNLLICFGDSWTESDTTMKASLLFSCLMALWIAATSAQAGVRRADTNPALLYYRAILLSPEISSPHELSQEEMMTVRSPLPEERVEPTPERVRLVEAYEASMRLVREAAESTVPCDWGTDHLDDPGSMLALYGRVRALSGVARFRARCFLDWERQADAVSELLAAWIMVRNIAAHGTLHSVLVQASSEVLLADFIAGQFHRFDESSRRALAVGLRRMSERPAAADTISQEQQRFIASELEPLKQLRAAAPGNDQVVLNHFRQSRLRDGHVQPPHEMLARADQVIAHAGGTAEGLLRYLESVLERHESVEAFLRLPLQDYLERLDRVSDELNPDGNLIAENFVRYAVGTRDMALVAEVRSQMILAALSYRLDGEAGFMGIQDPAGDGPFTMRRVTVNGEDRGFSLASALQVSGYPEILVFIEQPGAPLFVSGTRAGQLRPPPPPPPSTSGYDALMLERYGIKPTPQP